MAKKVIIYAVFDSVGKIYLKGTQREILEIVKNSLSRFDEVSIKVETHIVYLEEVEDET